MPYNLTADDISPVIVYAGNWTDFCSREPNKDSRADLYSLSTFHASNTPGSTATIRFNGTAIYIYGAKRPTYGHYTVSVDNGTAQQFDAHSELQGGEDILTQQLLFGQTGLEDSLHEVVFMNTVDSSGRATVDIDYVTWTVGGDSSQPLVTEYDDAHQNWTYTGPWKLRGGLDSSNNTTHQVDALGARASFVFEGVGIYLYGHLRYNHGNFNVTIDDTPPVTLNSFASAWFPQVLLYYVDGLDPGTHTLTAINGEENKVLSLDHVRVLNAASPTKALIDPPEEDAQPINIPGIIGSIIGGMVALVILAAVLRWYWIRRRDRYDPVDIIEPRSENILPPPVGYAPRSAGPGWVDGGRQLGHAPNASFPNEKAVHRSSNGDGIQLALNVRLMRKMGLRAT